MRRKRNEKAFKKTLLVALVGILALSAAGCGSSTASSTTLSSTPTIDKIKKAGKLVVGTAADTHHMNFILRTMEAQKYQDLIWN
ncbi:hypothetical protein [Clostridium sp. DMHC 10]|uniref:hypothetical protein n=1 Tax=Clostridium sp. DMHC 10 TaxID=747377 RepID=UPI000AE25094|nr:hypothetical protein [Clostridium sp. DMHC 10]